MNGPYFVLALVATVSGSLVELLALLGVPKRVLLDLFLALLVHRFVSPPVDQQQAIIIDGLGHLIDEGSINGASLLIVVKDPLLVDLYLEVDQICIEEYGCSCGLLVILHLES